MGTAARAAGRRGRRPAIPSTPSADALKLSALIGDAIDSDDSGIEDALRPLYLDYLTKHKADLPALLPHEHRKEH